MDDRDKKYGVIGSTVFHVLVLLLLIFFGLKTIPQEEEGILVNFGDTVLGQGEVEPKESQAPPVEQKKTPPPPPMEEKIPEPQTSQPEPEDEVKTQDFDEAPVIKSDAQKKKEKEEKERLEKERKEREELERIEREKEIERQKEVDRLAKIEAEKEAQHQKELAEQRAREEAERKEREEKERQAAEARNRVSGAFSGKGSGESTSEGDTGGNGNQGEITGDPNSRNRSGSGKGNSGSGFSITGLGGRGIKYQPEIVLQTTDPIEYKFEIKVDKHGNVISARCVYESYINRDIRSALERRVKEIKIDPDPNSTIAVGIITFKE